MKQKPFSIHFVCRGNTYRSRLAAAYMDTLVDERFAITSSGIGTHHAKVQTAEAYTKATAKVHQLSHGIEGHKTQTTNALLKDADILIFMNKDVYDDALKVYDVDIRKSQVWHVHDIDPVYKQEVLAQHSERALIEAVATTFASIQRHCNELYAYLTHTAWTDVVDADNHAAGLRLPMAWITDRGLWHRGIHVVVQTTDGKYVVGKRDKSIVFAPGMLEISLGGGMDSGETPLQAARRETHEELGLSLPDSAFRPLFTYRKNSYHPHYNKRTRCHVYTFAVTVPMHSSDLLPQPGEVAELRLLSKRQVQHMLHSHRMAHFGHLVWNYKFYQKAIAYSSAPV